MIKLIKYNYIFIFLLGVITIGFPFAHDYIIWHQINLGTIDSLFILTGFVYILIGFSLYLIQKYWKRKLFKYQEIVILILFILSIFGIYIYSLSISSRQSQWRLLTYELNKTNTLKFKGKAYHLSQFLANEVNDIKADFVADPFTIKHKQTQYCFFEAGNKESKKGEIGLAISSNGIKWNYEKIVLSEPFHISFPLVFKEDNHFYMIPESSQDSSVRLYKATDFPIKWKLDTILLSGQKYMDNVVFKQGNIWWLFTSTTNDNLLLFFSNSLQGPWEPHPKNPIRENYPDGSRMAGKIFIKNDSLFRIAQDDYPNYGNNIKTFYINKLDSTSYEEKEIRFFPDFRALNSFSTNGVHSCSLIETDSSYLVMIDGY